jgi:hypothetical protein
MAGRFLHQCETPNDFGHDACCSRGSGGDVPHICVPTMEVKLQMLRRKNLPGAINL